ncbi:MAG: HD phosphohydrolase, partial [Edafosvirus sp.]
RKLHQLGTCLYVFQNATHTRFEHSIGTYHMANKILKCIKERTPKENINKWLSDVPELKNYFKKKYNGEYQNICMLDDYICELVKIAALCHDLGHGPFSHVFDDVFIPSVKKVLSPMDTHETRSGIILEKIIKNDILLSTLIGDDEIQFIKNLIDPKSNNVGFIYQIVSNHYNSMDVDKCDYITRDIYMLGLPYGIDFSRLINEVYVINNIICYPKQIYYEIACLFETRYRLHKQIYCHKTVIATQYMINEIMILMNPILKLSDSVNDMDKFCMLTDDYILTSIELLRNMKTFGLLNDNIEKAYQLLNMINKREIYAQIDSYVSDKKLDINKKDFADVADVNLDKIIIYTNKIGFVSGNKKYPLDNIHFYETKLLNHLETPKLLSLEKNMVSLLIPETYQEYITIKINLIQI